MSDFFAASLTVLLTHSYDKKHPPFTHTTPTYTHSDITVAHPSSEAMTSIKLAIVIFSVGWRKELYFSAEVWPDNTRLFIVAIFIKPLL